MKTKIEFFPEIKADLIEAFSLESETIRKKVTVTLIVRLLNLSADSEELRLSLYQAADALLDAVSIMDAVLGINNVSNIEVIRIADQAKYCKQVERKEFVKRK
jgi:hypothetical protein